MMCVCPPPSAATPAATPPGTPSPCVCTGEPGLPGSPGSPGPQGQRGKQGYCDPNVSHLCMNTLMTWAQRAGLTWQGLGRRSGGGVHVWCELEVCGHVLQPVTSVPFSFCWSALLPLGKKGSSRQWGARLKGEGKRAPPGSQGARWLGGAFTLVVVVYTSQEMFISDVLTAFSWPSSVKEMSKFNWLMWTD